jgi:hypothetical protein
MSTHHLSARGLKSVKRIATRPITRWHYCETFACIALGAITAVAGCYFGWFGVILGVCIALGIAAGVPEFGGTIRMEFRIRQLLGAASEAVRCAPADQGWTVGRILRGLPQTRRLPTCILAQPKSLTSEGGFRSLGGGEVYMNR